MKTLPLFPDLPRNKRKPRVRKAVSLPPWFIGRGRELDYVCQGPKLRASVLKSWHEVVTTAGKDYVASFGPTKLTLEVTDYHHSIGAIHYYASVSFPRIRWTGPSVTVVECDGLYQTTHRVNITRPLPQREITGDPERYHAWKAGDPYTGFLTAQDAYDAAVRWIRKMTSGFTLATNSTTDYTYPGLVVVDKL